MAARPRQTWRGGNPAAAAPELNCFQTVRTDRRRGCPPRCLIGTVHHAASSGIPHVWSLRPLSPVLDLCAREEAPAVRSRAPFRVAHRQSVGRPEEPKGPKDPGSSQVPPSVPRRGPRFLGRRLSFSPAHCSHVRPLRGVGPRPNELHAADGKSPFEFGAVSTTREAPPGLRRSRHMFCFGLLT